MAAYNLQSGLQSGMYGLGGLGSCSAASNSMMGQQTNANVSAWPIYYGNYYYDHYGYGQLYVTSQSVIYPNAVCHVEDDAAIAKAEELLLLYLNDEQRAQYKQDGYFETIVSDKRYRIRNGRAMNVELIENGKAKFKYCALPSDYAPAPDVMLAQLLMLETDEAKFLATANRTIL